LNKGREEKGTEKKKVDFLGGAGPPAIQKRPQRGSHPSPGEWAFKNKKENEKDVL